MEENTHSNKLIWVVGGLSALAVFVLCFLAIDYVSQPDKEKGPEVKMEIIATMQTNGPLITIARQQGWIAADATEMSSVDAAQVKELGTAFQGSNIRQLDELGFFVGLQEIHEGAFAHSDALATITIPAYVTTIEYGALADCPALREIHVDTANTHYDSRQDCNAVISTWKGSLMVVAGCSTTTVLNDVDYIAPKAFQGCTAMKSITLPSHMKEIGEEAFSGCSSLQDIDIPQGVRFVEASTFHGCTALRSVALPKSVERLRKDAFGGCTSLATIKCMKKYPPIIESAFDTYQATVYVPKGMQNTYYADHHWKDFPRVEESAE